MHLSIDLWNTLLTPNQTFTQKFNEYFAGLFSVSVDVVERAYAHTNDIVKNDTIQSSITISPYQSFECLCGRIMYIVHDRFHHGQDIEKIISDINSLFIEHPPIMDESAVAALYFGRHNWSISCNTTFIGGKIIRQILKDNYGMLTDRGDIFSDEVGVSKPNLAFFALVSAKNNACIDQIIHISNDIDNDIVPGCKFGYCVKYCPSPDKLGDILASFEDL